MTRKRFVKLLMAQGIDRNTAQGATCLVSDYQGKSYAEYYNNFNECRARGLPADEAIVRAYYPTFDFTPLHNFICDAAAAAMDALSRFFAACSETAANASAAFSDMRTDRAARNDAVDAFSYSYAALNSIGGSQDENH